MIRKLILFFFTLVCTINFINDNFFFINLLSLILCILILYINNFDLTKLTSIIVIGHLIQYSIASFLANNQSVYSSMVMSDDEYSQTFYSISLMSIGIFGLFIGILLLRIIFDKPILFKKQNIQFEKFSFTTIILSFSLYIIYIILALITHTYFHSTAGDTNIDASQNFGFIGYLYYFGIVSVILQYCNFLISNERKDFLIFIIILILFEILIIPSGQRRFIILPVFIISLLFFTYRKINLKKSIIIISIIPLLIMVLPLLEYLRGDLNGLSIFEIFSNFDFLKDKIFDSNSGGSPAFALFIRRISDYPSVGYINDLLSRNVINYYGFKDLLESPFYLIPTFFRPDISLNFAYDAIIMQDIGFRSEINGSSPIMLVGELLIRGGLLSIFFGFVIIGILFELISYNINTYSKSTLFIVWIFLLDYFSMIHTMTILKIFTLLTRHLFIFYIFSIFLKSLSNFKSKIIK